MSADILKFDPSRRRPHGDTMTARDLLARADREIAQAERVLKVVNGIGRRIDEATAVRRAVRFE